MRRLFIAMLATLLLFSALGANATAASGQPLPPLPSPAIINSVITQTGGPDWTPLGIPNYVMTQLNTFTGVFSNIENMIDPNESVHYITMGATLRETVMPLINSTTAVLTPDMTAPGASPKPGKIVGVLFQPWRTVMPIVTVFKSDGKLDKIRFYYNSTQYYEYKLKAGKFNDKDNDGAGEVVDGGAIIADKYDCVTVGLEQVCWEPYDDAFVRDGDNPRNAISGPASEFAAIYDLDVDFHVDDAVPDLIGANYRTNCASQLGITTIWVNLTNCVPNLVFTSAMTTEPNQPIGIFKVLQAADLKAYTKTGVYTGSLPAGNYLVMVATPNVTVDGAVGVLYLVNSDTQNHYLIPVFYQQGVSSAIDNKNYAVIKDGACGGWRF